MLKFYTDGSCKLATKEIGWAVVIPNDGHIFAFSGYKDKGTPSEAELTAGLRALQFSEHLSSCIIISDSKLLVNGLSDWMYNKWVKDGWKKNGSPISYDILWRKMYDIAVSKDVLASHVKGHAGNVFNELADKLAKEAITDKRGGIKIIKKSTL